MMSVCDLMPIPRYLGLKLVSVVSLRMRLGYGFRFLYLPILCMRTAAAYKSA
jgi:hypothetical protein